MSQFNLLELLDYIELGATSYTEWIEVGMALKAEGYTVSNWDTWSQEIPNVIIQKKYITSGIPSRMKVLQERRSHRRQKNNGWQSRSERRDTGALDWNSTISDELSIKDDA
ncbi:PriCT-2 domain-containing protein [Aerococcaceae bacterium INB8]|uniref:PriCT-2 domain-containing protein n=1 Tax=Ruoffia halotolerans TaxID=2748684 RepID=A0A839A7E6_9LACT|nr:PriCT-2 domain-containing protein [Ruoffia halotolerans]MBA5729475.1 PriCT-2 domain-containing protein [Ruoffia halotolerans]